ncbi:MAG: putative nucleic acid-binding protein, contains Zn-ribbon domain [Chloroflexi bacterium]|nr:MAG: putative nucleic acid-binding protein, contains Zn-ribbon domain [Chloroflexota bacterium]
MINLRSLYQLQKLDLEVDGQQSSLIAIEEAIADKSKLNQLQSGLEINRENSKKYKIKQSGVDGLVHELQEKSSNLKGRLYDGSITNVKEMESVTAELEYANQELNIAEEELLSLMLKLENNDKEESQIQDALTNYQLEQRESNFTLTKELDSVKSLLDSNLRERESLAKSISALLLTQYERIRKVKQGLGITEVKGGRCMACLLTLPTKQLQQLRSAAEINTCTSCGRILFVN